VGRIPAGINKEMNKFLAAISLLFIQQILVGQVALKPSEKLIYSFQTIGKKIVLIAIDTVHYKVIYRFGTTTTTELEIIHDTVSGDCDVTDTDIYRNTFSYNYYYRWGGAENLGEQDDYFEFINNGIFYSVFYEYYADGNSADIGIRVTNLQTKKEVDIKGKLKTQKGSLEVLRFRKYVITTYGNR
jgi:hypothetical protein